MTNKKKNPSRSVPSKQRNKAPKKKKAPRPSVPPSIIHQVCGLTDPFCSHAIGAKLPDNSGIRSLTYPLHFRTQLSTNASGVGAFLFVPSYSRVPWLTGTMTGNVGAFGPFISGNRLAGVQMYRIVTAGIKARRISAPLESSGMLHVRGFATKVGSPLASIDITSYNCDFYHDQALQDSKDVAVLFRQLDSTATLFSSPDATTPTTTLSDWVSPGWGVFTIGVSGAPASKAVLDIEVFINMEVTFADDESTALLATPPPKSNPVVTDSLNYITSQARSVFANGASQASSYVAREASRVVSDMIRTQIPRLGASLALAL